MKLSRKQLHRLLVLMFMPQQAKLLSHPRNVALRDILDVHPHLPKTRLNLRSRFAVPNLLSQQSVGFTKINLAIQDHAINLYRGFRRLAKVGMSFYIRDSIKHVIFPQDLLTRLTTWIHLRI